MNKRQIFNKKRGAINPKNISKKYNFNKKPNLNQRKDNKTHISK